METDNSPPLVHHPRPTTHLLRVLALLLALCVSSGVARAQDGWPTLTARNGLAATSALSLAYAPDGSLWMGGMKGVTRWDGQTATVWSRFDGLGDDWVTALVVVNGTTWAGTYGGGLSRYDPQAERPWQTLTRQDGLPNDHITALAAGPDGTLWVGTYGGGLARVRGGRVERVTEGPPSPWITALTVTSDGDVWVGTWGEGVARFSGQSWTVYRQELPDPFIRALAADRAGGVYVGTGLGLAVWERGPWRVFSLADGLPDRRVTGLALDAQGTVWAGTARGLARRDGDRWRPAEAGGLPNDYILALAAPGAGGAPTAGRETLAVASPAGVTLVAGPAPPPPPTLLPVLFVHGWRGAPNVTLYESEARFLKRWLDERGQYSLYVPGIDSNDTLYANAQRLRDAIAQVKRQTGAPRVHLVGHSMGGLTSRAYLESALYQGDVASLTTLGSPHSGAVQWREYLVREVSRGGAEPSARELLPEHVALFNGLGQRPADVPYYLLGGDITRREGLDWLRFWPPTDAVVSLWSALSLDGPGVTTVQTDDLHGWAAGSVAAGISSYLWPDDNYQRVLRDILSGRPPAAYQTGGPRPERPTALPRTPILTGQLRPGAVVTQTLTLDAVAGARVFALWQRGQVTTTLTSPDGKVYRQGGGTGVDYFGFNFDTFANMAVYKLDKPTPGRWQMRLAAPATAPTTDYGVYAELDSATTLTVATDGFTYAPGAPVQVRATLTPLDQTRGAAVTVELSVGGRVAQRAALTDDGTNGDAVAGDGVYNGGLTAPGPSDYYAVLVTARGPDGQFERSASAVLTVRSDRARLAGDATVQPGQDGAQVAMPVEVREAGPFAVAVQVEAGGQTSRAVLPVTLSVGRQTVTVPLRGVAPTAVVKSVQLLDNRTALIPLDSR